MQATLTRVYYMLQDSLYSKNSSNHARIATATTRRHPKKNDHRTQLFQLCGGGHLSSVFGESSMFAKANRIIWLISSFRLIPISAALTSRIWSVSVEMRIEITSFSGLRAINFANQITIPLAYCIRNCYNKTYSKFNI